MVGPPLKQVSLLAANRCNGPPFIYGPVRYPKPHGNKRVIKGYSATDGVNIILSDKQTGPVCCRRAQVGIAEPLAVSGETFISPQAFELIQDRATGILACDLDDAYVINVISPHTRALR